MSEEHKPMDESAKLPMGERLKGRFGIVGEFIGFLWEEKIWWMIPMVVVLLGLGLLIVFANTNAAIAPLVPNQGSSSRPVTAAPSTAPATLAAIRTPTRAPRRVRSDCAAC